MTPSHRESLLRKLASTRTLEEQLRASLLLIRNEGREAYRRRKWEGKGRKK